MVAAQEKSNDTQAPPKSGFRAEFLKQLEDVGKKIVELAQAVPEEKFSWRPAEGVRSVSEVYIHLAGANFLLPNNAGIKPPAGLDRDMEKNITEKAKVIEILKESFKHVRDAIMETSDADLDKPTKLFGRETTVRDVFLTIALHQHEHLGQSIAYARMNGVVPPWTAERQSQQQQRKQD
jgi:uncharacterized damage-inducible protein DinB